MLANQDSPEDSSLNYTWVCNDTTRGIQCLDLSGNSFPYVSNVGSLYIPGNTFKPGTTLRFGLKVQADTRVSNLVVADIGITNNTNLIVEVKGSALNNSRVNGQIPTFLSAYIFSLNTFNSYHYSWSFPKNVNISSLNILNENPNVLSYQYIEINPNQLQPNLSYVINCTVSQSSGVVGTVPFIFQVNNPPQAGNLNITPNVGDEYSTNFFIDAPNWVDIEGDYPLRYQLTYKFVGDDAEYSLNSYIKSTVQSYMVQMPAGRNDTFYQLEVYLTVSDSLGSVTTVSQIVVVNPANDPTNLVSNIINQINNINAGIEIDAINAYEKAIAFIHSGRSPSLTLNLSTVCLTSKFYFQNI